MKKSYQRVAPPSKPSCLIRIDDGAKYILNADFTYSPEVTDIYPPYTYTYSQLMATKAFRHMTRHEQWTGKINIPPSASHRHSGCGDDFDD